MKCPKHKNCVYVNPHDKCFGGIGVDVTRRAICKYCYKFQITDSEFCEFCDNILPWPPEYFDEKPH